MWLIVSFYATFGVELILNVLVGSLQEDLREVPVFTLRVSHINYFHNKFSSCTNSIIDSNSQINVVFDMKPTFLSCQSINDKRTQTNRTRHFMDIR